MDYETVFIYRIKDLAVSTHLSRFSRNATSTLFILTVVEYIIDLTRSLFPPNFLQVLMYGRLHVVNIFHGSTQWYIYYIPQISMHPHFGGERYQKVFFLCIDMKKYEALVFKVFYSVLSTTILAMLGVFSFISSTIPLPKNYSTLFATSFELVVMARSTRMIVFILFHIITAMIFYRSSSKPKFESELDKNEVLSETHTKEEVSCGDKCHKSVGEFPEDDEDFNGVLYDADDESFEINDGEEEEEEGHGDLRGRIENFITSVTRTWKEELLKEKKLLCLVEDTDSLYMLVPYDMV